ncbi:MAG: hypothetical protein J6U67_10230 [Lachnospiraceae bacterium]|nr:hypothetical protein [Lachnospiraceae bacterium]
MVDIQLTEHRAEIERLLAYIPWLEEKSGTTVAKVYNDNDLSKTSVSFPVYDATLLSFVKEADATGLMYDNYRYIYSAYGLKTFEDERRAIEDAGVKDGDVLCGILTRYVKGGITKGIVWTDAVREGIFLLVLKKMKKLLEIWDAPLA